MAALQDNDNQNNKNRKRPLEDPKDSEPPLKKIKLNDSLPPLSTEQVVAGLAYILDTVKQPIDLTVGGKSSLPLIPELNVKGIGAIPLPICEQQLPLLLSVCTKSSFGHGLKTENDENVRNCFELNADHFHFNHPDWKRSIRDLVGSVCIQLGCDRNSITNVKAHRYKLLVYTKDGHFLEHRDTQKVDGMFATLIVQLPSDYKVVDDKATLIVKHRNKSFEFYFGVDDNENKHNIFYTAHYCDLPHRINKIQSGVRIAVIYNLCWNGPKQTKPMIDNFDNLTSEIKSIVTRWNEPSAIAVDLEHLYTESEFVRDGIQALKGLDAAKIELLSNSVESDLRIFFARLEREVEETGGHGYGSWGGEEWDEVDRTEHIPKQWIDEDGDPFDATYIELNLLSNCIGYDDEYWEETNQDETEFYGNAAPTRSTTYEKCIAIMFKTKKEFEILLNGENGMAAAIQYLKVNGKAKTVATLRDVISGFDAHRTVHKTITPMLKILIKCGDLDLIEMFICKMVEKKIGLSAVDDAKYLFKIITKFGWIPRLKTFTLRWLECGMLKGSINSIYLYCMVQQLIQKHSQSSHNEERKDENDDDDPVIILNDSNKEISNECLGDVSSTLLDCIMIRLNLKDDGEALGELNTTNIVHILRLMSSVKDVPSGMHELFVKNYIENVDPKTQTEVAEHIKRWKGTSLTQSECTQSIIHHQIKCISDVLGDEPQFSWRMPSDEVSGDRAFANFLRSDRQTFTKTGFKGIAAARVWAETYKSEVMEQAYSYWNRNNRSNVKQTKKYTVTCAPLGTGKRARVDVNKTKDYFNSIKAKYDKKMQRMTSLMELLK
eukprot:217177_1